MAIIFIGVLLLTAGACYFFFQISVGIWFPAHANMKQRQIVASAPIQAMLPFLRWFSPIATVIIFIQLVVGIVEVIGVWYGLWRT